MSSELHTLISNPRQSLTNDQYAQLQEIARKMWNAQNCTEACYVQKVSNDEWRVCDKHGSIIGYQTITKH